MSEAHAMTHPPGFFMVASRATIKCTEHFRLSEDAGASPILTATTSPPRGLAAGEVELRLGPVMRPWWPYKVVMSEDQEARALDELGRDDIVAFLLNPRIPAVFRPQAWQRDYAIDIDGQQRFDALPALLKMSFEEVCMLLSRDSDFDDLADELPARKSHSGPFEVELPSAAAIPLAVKLLLGLAIEEVDLLFVEGMDLEGLIDEAQWDAFRARAAEMIAARERVQGTVEASPLSETERLQAEVLRLTADLDSARSVVSILYAALEDASTVVDASDGEEYAYQAQLEAARTFFGIKERSQQQQGEAGLHVGQRLAAEQAAQRERQRGG